jgi:hypothetical protein
MEGGFGVERGLNVLFADWIKSERSALFRTLTASTWASPIGKSILISIERHLVSSSFFLMAQRLDKIGPFKLLL